VTLVAKQPSWRAGHTLPSQQPLCCEPLRSV